MCIALGALSYRENKQENVGIFPTIGEGGVRRACVFPNVPEHW